MTRGLVIGKFLPIHKGHIALIEFAASQCDEVIVSMSFTPYDPIDPELRFSWIQKIFKDDHRIKPAMIADDFDDPSLDWPARTEIWSAVIKKAYPGIGVVFSSEEYGEPFAHNLGVRHVMFDQSRLGVPVSATLIRNHPAKYWSYIPDVVRPWFVTKVCFYGPESTGKTSMTQRMAERFQTTFVPEVAREFLIRNDFSLEDIINIGLAHDQRIREKIREANRFLMCDTDAITTQIYSRHYLGVVPDILFELEQKTRYDHYFLFDIDVAWVPDGLRDLGDQRLEMMRIFRTALEERKIPYTLVQGTYQEREELCEKIIRSKFL
jgi:HTH-type transcriptional repressor of NAD biosynthesis genes